MMEETTHNIIFDFENVLVRWEPERLYLPYFQGDEAQYWYFWRHVCTQQLRNRIDAGEDQRLCIDEQKRLFPEYSEPLDMFITDDPCCQVFGLTNWSMETFPLARRRFGILQLIDRYIVSADVHIVKPDPAIFRLALGRFGIAPASTTFIDDNPANVKAATDLGMKGIVFTNAGDLRIKLKQSGIWFSPSRLSF